MWNALFSVVIAECRHLPEVFLENVSASLDATLLSSLSLRSEAVFGSNPFLFQVIVVHLVALVLDRSP